MDPIYVTGHRNPDTDSIVAAMAYAALRNAVGDREYKAACLGRVSDETQLVLDRFGFEPPKRITSMYTQVQDLDFDTPPVLDANVTVAQAWKTFQAQPSIPALPVANEDGTLYGMLSKDYIATYNMDLIAGAELADVPLFNVLSVLEGKVLNDAGDQVDTISGKVTIALPQNRESLLWSRKDSIVFCGTQPDMIRRALEMNVTAVVLCQAELDEELRNYPTTTCIISTPYAAYRATRMIFQSTPIGRICRKNDLVCFHLEDRVDDVKEAVLKHRESCYPILDGDEKIAGVLSRYHLLRPRRKRVVLVDHNEAAQSVPGLEEALTRAGHTLIPVCPEVDGGLPTPRPPAELQSDGRVVNREGKEVTAQYQAGAELAARLAQEHGCTVAVLKAKSPSCGGRQVYDGSFSKRLIPGQGCAARRLAEMGVKLLDETNWRELG